MPKLTDRSTAASTADLVDDTDYPLLDNVGRAMPHVIIEPGHGGTITILNDYDVLCGTSNLHTLREYNNNPGNVNYRTIISQYKHDPIMRLSVEKKGRVYHVAATLVARIRTFGGRFVIDDPGSTTPGVFIEIGDLMAWKKVVQELYGNVPSSERITNNNSSKPIEEQVSPIHGASARGTEMNDLLLQTKRRVRSQNGHQTMQEHNMEIGGRLTTASLEVVATGTTGATMTQHDSSSTGYSQSDDNHMTNLDQMELDGLRQLLKSKREAAKHSFNQGEVQAVIRMINKKQNDMMKEAEREEVNEQEIEESFGGSQMLYRHRQLQEEVRIGMRGGGGQEHEQENPRALQQEHEIQLQSNDHLHKQRECQEVDTLMKTDNNDAPPAPANTTTMPVINKAYLQRLNSNLESEQRYPPGCPVWFSFTSDQRDCTCEAYQGVVKANYINMKSKFREIVCEIEYNKDTDTCDQIFVYDEQLQFASNCPVQVTGIPGVGYICPQFPPPANKTYAIQFSTSGGSRVTGIYNVDPKEVVYVPSKSCNDDDKEGTFDTTLNNIEETGNLISTGVEQEINKTNDDVDEQPSTVQIQQTSLEVPTVESERKSRVDASSSASFLSRVDKLRAYKEKHGHFNVREKEDSSLYNFAKNMRFARKNPKASKRKLTEDRIAALDAIGFDWNRQGLKVSAASPSTTIDVITNNTNNNVDEQSLAKEPSTVPNKGKSQKEKTVCPKDPSSSSEGITFNCPSCTKDYLAKASFSHHLKKCSLQNGGADESDGKLYRCSSNSEQKDTSVEAGTAQPKYSIGTVVSKVFHLDDEGVDRSFSGKVSAYDFEEGLYSITYEDGDEEEMNEMELEEIVVGIEKTNKQKWKKKDKPTTKKRKRMRDECGKCVNCKDMVKFGGKSLLRQKCLLRKCLNPTFTNKAEGGNEVVKMKEQRATVEDDAATVTFDRQGIDTNAVAVALRVPRSPPIPGYDEKQSKVDSDEKRQRLIPKNYAEDEKDNVECDVEVKKTDDGDDDDDEVLHAAVATSIASSLPPQIAVPLLPVGQTELTVPCPEIGIGWTQRVVARKSVIDKSVNGRTRDRYFYAPPTIDGKRGTMFRSLVEVKRYFQSNTDASTTNKTNKEKVFYDENGSMDEKEEATTTTTTTTTMLEVEKIVPLHVPRKPVSIQVNSDMGQFGLSLLCPKRANRSMDVTLDRSFRSEEHNSTLPNNNVNELDGTSKSSDMDMARQLKVAPSSEVSQNQNGSPLKEQLTCVQTVPLWVEKCARKSIFVHLFGKDRVIHGKKCTAMSYNVKTFVNLSPYDRQKRVPLVITISTRTGKNNLLHAKRLIMESIIEFLADSDSERRLVYEMELNAEGTFPIEKVDDVVKARCHRSKRVVWMKVLRLRCPKSVTSSLSSEDSQRQFTSGTNCKIELHGLSKDSFSDPYVFIHGNRSDEVVTVSERISFRVSQQKNDSPSRKGDLRKRKLSTDTISLSGPSGSMELSNNRPKKASKFTQEQCVTDNSGVNDVLGTDSNLRPRTIKLRIGNLSSSTQPSMLCEYFTDLYGCASVLECVIPPGHPYPYGLVTMLEEYARDVLKCGQEHELDGRVLKVTKSVQIDEKPVKTPATPSSLRCPNCGYHSRWCTCIPTFVPHTATAPYTATAQDKESVGRTDNTTQQQQEENLSTDLENPEMKPRDKLPEGWACIWSKSQKRWYFFHNRTNKSVWDIEVIRNKS